MGTYYELYSKTSNKHIDFGKKLVVDDQYCLQGMYSEREGTFVNDVRCWQAIQRFLLDHQDEELAFVEDSVTGRAESEEVEFDDLVPPSSNKS